MPPQVDSAEDALRRGELIRDQHGTVTSADGTCLFYRYWPATTDWSGRAVIVLHGIGYHSGPYKVIADRLNPQGIDVYGLDARGHGLSCGRRGYIGTAAEIADDIASMMERMRRERPSARIFLLGDSMGCNYALAYAKHGNPPAGLILLAPAFFVDPGQPLRWQSLRLMPYFVFAHRKPVIELIGERLEESTRDAGFIRDRRTDALAYKRVSFGYLLDIQRLVRSWRRQIAPRVQIPILMIKGGKDLVVNHRDCVSFAQLSASSDLHFELYPEVRHTVLWDPQTPEILDRVGRWILEH